MPKPKQKNKAAARKIGKGALALGSARIVRRDGNAKHKAKAKKAAKKAKVEKDTARLHAATARRVAEGVNQSGLSSGGFSF